MNKHASRCTVKCMMIRLLMLSLSIKFQMKRWTKKQLTNDNANTFTHQTRTHTKQSEDKGADGEKKKEKTTNDHVKAIFVCTQKYANVSVFTVKVKLNVMEILCKYCDQFNCCSNQVIVKRPSRLLSLWQCLWLSSLLTFLTSVCAHCVQCSAFYWMHPEVWHVLFAILFSFFLPATYIIVSISLSFVLCQFVIVIETHF